MQTLFLLFIQSSGSNYEYAWLISITYLDVIRAIAVRISPIMERDAPIYVSVVNPGSEEDGGPILGWIAYKINTLHGNEHMC